MRITAVGVQHHDLTAVLLTGAIEIDADRVVQCGVSSGLQTADTVDETREVALTVTTASYLTREVDERHIDSLWQSGQKFDDGLLGKFKIEFLAAADVEQDSDVQRRSGRRSRGKREDRLRLAVLVDSEIVHGEIGDEPLFFSCDRDADIYQIDGPVEQCGIVWFALRRADNDRRRDRDGDRKTSGQGVLMHV